VRGELESTQIDVTFIFNDTKYEMAVSRLGPTQVPGKYLGTFFFLMLVAVLF
jgi:hypothetical protein